MKRHILMTGAIALAFTSTACSAGSGAGNETGNLVVAGNSPAEASAGNAATGEPATGNAAAERIIAAPAVNEAYDWAIRISEDDGASAILAYEVADTDDQPLSLRCDKGGKQIFAGISGGEPDLKEIVLSSGPQTLRVAGTTEAPEDEPPHFSSQEIAGDSPLIRAFAANGWLRMTAKGQDLGMTGTAKGKQAIKRFVEFCTG